MAIVSRPESLRRAFSVHTSYLIATETGLGDPLEKVPEMSRRARGIPVWAALRQLGRSGGRLWVLRRALSRGSSNTLPGEPPACVMGLSGLCVRGFPRIGQGESIRVLAVAENLHAKIPEIQRR